MSEPDKLNFVKDWNAMIYLAGENNLAEECIFALKQMQRARPRRRSKNIDNRVKVVAQLDAGGLGGNEVRYLLKQNNDDGAVEENKDETADDNHDGLLHKNELTRVDTTQTFYQGVLKDFLSSSIIKGGRAKHYLIVLSGHGNGIISDFLSRDVETPDKLSIPKIQWVLEEVKQNLMQEFPREIDENFKFDILGLDSCMMSMAEIGYELRNYVNLMVGAEGFEPNAGWPYERILSDILNDPDIKPRDLAIRIVERYIRYYKDFLPAGRSVDHSACDLGMCDKLATAIRKLADVLHEKISDQKTMRAVVLAHWEAQSYKDDQYVDLYDFCDLLDRGSLKNNSATGSVVMTEMDVDEKIKDECKNVKKILTGNGTNSGNSNGAERMVLKSCHSGPAVQYSHGLSVYFPWSHVIDSYKDLEFAKATNWLRFLTKYTDVTRRHKRACTPTDPKVPVVIGELFVNTTAAGFDFILTENKNTPVINKVLSNRVGSMKNPPIDHVPCDCPLTRSPDKENGKSVEPEDPKWVKVPSTTETSEPDAEPVVETKVEPILQPTARRMARKK